jgi:hypothetical protein
LMPANERVKATEGRAYFQVLCYLEVRCCSRALVSALGALPLALGCGQVADMLRLTTSLAN